jgi:hypothetical protein
LRREAGGKEKTGQKKRPEGAQNDHVELDEV